MALFRPGDLQLFLSGYKNPTDTMIDLKLALPRENARCIGGIISILKPRNIKRLVTHLERHHLKAKWIAFNGAKGDDCWDRVPPTSINGTAWPSTLNAE